jgi:hypothetical protein
MRDLSVDLPDSEISGFSKDFRFSLTTHFTSWPPLLRELGPLDLQKVNLQGGLPPNQWVAHFNLKSQEIGLSHIHFHLDGDLKIPDFPKLGMKDCRFHLKMKTKNLQIQCPISASYSSESQIVSTFKIPKKIGGLLLANLNLTDLLLSGTSRIEGPVEIILDPMVTPFFRASGQLKAQAKGTVSEFPQGWDWDTDLAFKLEVPSFGKIVRRLTDTPWAIPAPFHVLKGQIELNGKGQMDFNRGRFPIDLKTQLNSQSQVLNVNATGEVQIEGLQTHLVPRVFLDLMLADVQLELPRLDLGIPPRLIPDDRMVKVAQILSKDRSILEYQLRMSTPKHNPLRIKRL